MGISWRVVMVLFIVILPSSTRAAQIAGVQFQNSFDLGSQGCSLVGVGTRDILFFNIYAAGLYMQTPAHDAGQVITSDEPKAFVIHFLHKRASVSSLKENWRKAFHRAVPVPSPPLSDRIDQFISIFDRDALRGDEIAFLYEPQIGVRIMVGQEERGVIQGNDFMEALFSVWFGPKPSDRLLKKDILGGRGCLLEFTSSPQDATATGVAQPGDCPSL